jgi:hypothetical protein
MKPAWPAWAAALVAVVSALSCSKKEGPIDGIGPWHLGKSVASQGAICQPQDGGLTWCSHNPEMTIAEHRASVDLYFRGHQPDAVLVEILLALSAPCNREAVDRWLTHRLGAATRTAGQAIVWQGEAATIAALLPAADGECRIHFVSPGDRARLAALEKEAGAAR